MVKTDLFTWLQKIWQAGGNEPSAAKNSLEASQSNGANLLGIDIPPSDPLLAHLLRLGGTVKISDLDIDSPVLQQLKQSGIKMIVPLIYHGELIGLLSLGPRRSEQEYSTDDRQYLTTLAAQASPALKIAQMVKHQRNEERQRERLEQEMRVARVVQETLLPKKVPLLPNWQITAHWQPAQAVSGDFYDFIPFADGKLGVVIADVTDKGVPAALVMATTRNTLRSAAERFVSPGQVLAETNNLLCPYIPMSMFITCLYALLDPASGQIRYANAGHPPPYKRTPDQIVEMRARGMPLGLMPDMVYEEKDITIHPGESVIMYSDGLLEAHDPQGEMFGFLRIREILQTPACGEALIKCMLSELTSFTGSGWEQEDDVTFVCLDMHSFPHRKENGGNATEKLMAEFIIPSEPGNEKTAMEQVAEAIQELQFSPRRLERLKTAVAEATMNAIEHGNQYRTDKPVHILVFASKNQLRIEIIDYGGGKNLPEPETADLEKKLQGLQSPRGWGRFLIKNLVDEMNDYVDEKYHTLELIFNLPGDTL